MLHQSFSVDALRVLDEAQFVQLLAEPLGILREPCVDDLGLELDLLHVEPLCHAEVEKRDLAVIHKQVVAGVGVCVEVLQLVDRAEVEAKDDLPKAAALPPPELLDVVETQALHVLANQHPVA